MSRSSVNAPKRNLTALKPTGNLRRTCESAGTRALRGRYLYFTMFNSSSTRVVIAALLVLTMSAANCGHDSPVRPSPTPAGLAVNSVTPAVGLADSPRTIVGTGFQPGTTVELGDTVMNATVTGSTIITGMAPPHAEGTVDLFVTNPGGQSVRVAGAFSDTQLRVTGVAPSQGIIGKWLKIVGTGFMPGTKVFLDGLEADTVQQGGVSLFALAPIHAEGSVDVVVTNPNGSSSALPGGFIYRAVTVTASPAVVPPGGQLTVSWVAPPGQSDGDWIGLFKAGEPVERWYFYTGGLTSGTRTLTAPTELGEDDSGTSLTILTTLRPEA